MQREGDSGRYGKRYFPAGKPFPLAPLTGKQQRSRDDEKGEAESPDGYREWIGR